MIDQSITSIAPVHAMLRTQSATDLPLETTSSQLFMAPPEAALELRFQINERYLVQHTLVRSKPGFFVRGVAHEHLIEFQDKAWQIDRDAYNFLRVGIDGRMLVGNPGSIAEMGRRVDALMTTLINDSLFRTIRAETEESLSLLENDWHRDFQTSLEIMRDITGIQLSGCFDVYVTHPAQKNGRNLGGPIAWAYRKSFPHYNTVYLWHEILHNFFELNDDSHAVIELLADNELRIRLNGGEYPPLKGHADLHAKKVAILPLWREYLQRRDRNALDFVAEIRKSKLPQGFMKKSEALAQGSSAPHLVPEI